MKPGLSIRVVEAQRALPPVKPRAEARARHVNYNLVVMPSIAELGNGVARCLGIKSLPMFFRPFGDAELYHRVEESAQGRQTFVVWSPRHTDELLHADIHQMYSVGFTLSRLVKSVHGVFPHIPYLTQDRQDKPRAALSAAAMINLIGAARYDQITTFDMHTASLECAFDVLRLRPEHYFASPIFSRFLLALTEGRLRARELKVLGLLPDEAGKPRDESEIMVRRYDPADFISAATDIGAQKRALRLAESLFGKELADSRVATAIKKRDVESGDVSLSSVIGPDLKDKIVVLIDDLLRTAGTLEIAAGAIKKAGARKVLACVTHPEMNDGAVERCQAMMRHGWLDLLVTTNSIDIPEEKRFPHLTQIQLDPIIAALIHAEANHLSTSKAFQRALRGNPLQVVRYE